ncbi:MAG TPA: hypothetical protein VFM38_04520 [Candidatus Limnocylindrales bacterium]|nr:hypothetical protein [Candidatus Limnocylindrales bacterium]
MARRGRSFAVLVGLCAALMVASSASAASPWLSIRQQGVSAIGQRVDCTDNGDNTMACQAELLDAFKGTVKITGSRTVHADQVCYERLSATIDVETGDLIDGSAVAGCAVDTGKVTVRSLGSVVLASTRIDLTSLSCDESGCSEQPAGQVTVRGSWSSAGRPVVSREKFRFDDGMCTDVLASQGRVRQAAFSGTANGARIRADVAAVAAGTFRIKSRCLAGLP